ncbi:NAD-dependent epimerase/dehydratase family protein [Prochlorococcus sp. MIT 1306]|uniref:NAD-dependent epimerase/dehydratase family protein n=1 Tax=Prochlorococcus sp. MIT 1306 TaxID=1799667 RepID=UPI0007B3BA70|nr:NAD-dependent epimerase/dehydratase family protein [Prochlorococcus sp. MIT 1306]KZR61072.1 UDP-glucose 4-epimerase [Prochlorococcus sp. MIT 1306]
MRAVVTGGAGFIGSHLVSRLLEGGYEVSVIDNLSTGRLQNLSEFEKDIRVEIADLSKEGTWMNLIKSADVVYHMASLADIVPSIEDPKAYYNSNVTSTLNIAEAAKDNKTVIIYAASSSCYGLPKNIPTTEKDEIKAEYPYAMTKRLGEEIILHWAKVYNFRAISTRFFNVYGTRSRTSGTYGAVFGIFLAQKLAGKPFTIVGDGEQTRDFTYVTDIAEGLIKAYESKVTGEIFNLGSGDPKSINYLAKLLGGEKVYIPKRPGEPDVTHADISKAEQMLGYSPKVSFEDGVKKVLADISYWRDAPVWTPDSIEKATRAWFNHLG